MKHLHCLRLLCLLLFIHCMNNKCSAQSPNQILSMDVSSEAIGNNISPDSLPMITDSTIYSAEMNVSLYDTSDIQLLEVKIGTTDGGSDLFNNNFAFDVSGSIGNGLTYTRNGYTIHLGLGSLQGLSHYYSEVRLKHQDGTYSPSISFNR